VEKYK
jgi:hypothetical protein